LFSYWATSLKPGVSSIQTSNPGRFGSRVSGARGFPPRLE
jgi:hypothetical protein